MNTHLCGSLYEKHGPKCPHLLYATEKDQMYGKKKLNQYYVYCTAEGKCRSMGCAALWTGNSSKWCPKRRETESRTDG